MKSSHAERLASLILDDWPLPPIVKRWIESHPDVAREIAANRSLESRLRGAASPVVRRDVRGQAVYGQASKIGRLQIVVLAVAAALLVTIGWRITRERETLTVAPQAVESAKPLDAVNLQPLVASINAGEKVAVRLSEGLEDLASQFAGIGQKFSISAFRSERSKAVDLVEGQAGQVEDELE